MKDYFGASVTIAVFLLSIYRALNQGITHDEAITYRDFVSQPWSVMLTSYSANHHVLYNILAKVSVTWLGKSALSLRLPAVLGGLLFCLAFAGLLRELIPNFRGRFLLTLAMVSNPFLLDQFVVARGYGLGLGLLMCSLYAVSARISGTLSVQRFVCGGALAGAATAANLIVAPICLGICIAILFDWTNTFILRARMVLYFGGTAALSACLLLLGPLSQARSSHFYFGATTVAESIFSIYACTILYASSTLDLAGRPTNLTPRDQYCALALAAVILCLSVTAYITRKHEGGVAFWIPTCLFAAGVLHLVAFLTFGLRLPISRTALPLTVLTMTSALIGATAAAKSRKGRAVLLTLGASLAVYFSSQFDVHSFKEWRYASGSLRLYDMLLRYATEQDVPITVVASWQLAPCLDFYREISKTRLIGPIALDSLYTPKSEGRRPQADYIVTLQEDVAFLSQWRYSVRYQDPSGALLLQAH